MHRLHAVARSVAVLIGLSVVLSAVLAGPARAEDSTTDAASGLHAWTRTGLIPTFVPADGLVYVAVDVGIEQARAFVAFPDGETVPDVIELRTAESGSVLVEDAVISACPLTSPLILEGELGADAAPDANCDHAVDVEAGASGWSVRMGEFEERPAFGFALVPAGESATSFRLALDPTKTVVTTADSGVPSPDATDEPAAPTVPAPVTGQPSLSLTPPTIAPAGSVDVLPPPPGDDAPEAGPVAPAPVRALAVAVAGTAADPPAAVVLTAVGLVAAAIAIAAQRRRGASRLTGSGWSDTTIPITWRPIRVALVAAAVVVPVSFAEATTYKLGLVLILFVGAIGLHVLVNWTGELSLANATVVGLPAFTVAKLSADHGLSPISLIPVGVAVGAACGLVIGLPALRAKGLQVALVTLAGGVAIDRFFFTKPWLVGEAAGAAVETPTLGPLRFDDAGSLYPVLACLVALAVVTAWALYRSSLFRALLWIKADPSAAAAFGVPVDLYRMMAYVIAGSYAGLAGGLTAMWVQRLTPQAFPLERSFVYLIIVVLAGRGFVGGVAAAAFAIEGGRLFLANGDAFMVYAGPIGLLLTLVANRDGLNGLALRVRSSISSRGNTMGRSRDVHPPARAATVRPMSLIGIVIAAVGLGAIALAWYHAGNTDQVWIQNQEMISGGIGGLALLLVGLTLVVVDHVHVERAEAERRFMETTAMLAGRVDDIAAAAPEPEARRTEPLRVGS